MEPPTKRWLNDTVSALVYSIAQNHAEAHPDQSLLKPPYNDLTRFVLHQQAQLPDFLRAPMAAVTLGLDARSVLRNGLPFHARRPEARRAQIEAWKRSKLSVERDFIRYYESLATLALYGYRDKTDNNGASVAPEPPPQPRRGVLPRPAHELKCQIAVLGSGPGGTLTACLLAEAGKDVLLVEEGEFYTQQSCRAFSLDEMLQKYRNGGQTVALGKNKIAYVEGRCVGGGSEINSGLYHRTPPEVQENWRTEFQVEALTQADMVPHFEACERDLTVSLLPGPPPRAALKLREGAAKLGWKFVEAARWYDYTAGAPGGSKQTMTQTYVPRFLNAGGRLLPRTRVDRLCRNGAGWEIRADHRAVGSVRIEAETVFVSCGAVHTAALLRRSGIKRHIGNSLQIHPTMKVTGEFRETVNAPDMGVPTFQVREFAPRLRFGCSISSPPYLAVGLLQSPEIVRDITARWLRMASYSATITAEGRGTVRPLAHFRDPLVRYQLTAGDRRNLAEGISKLATILFEAGATAAYPTLASGVVLRSTQDLKKLPDILPEGLSNLITIHLFCTCPMGEDQSKCATDSFGRVHGFDNLFIADASLLCSAPGVNPQGSIMALVRRNTLHFLGQ